MDDLSLEMYWNDIPIGKDNATHYPTLCDMWAKSERQVRQILHELSHYDNGDNYILVRSAKSKGFYRTDDAETIEAYKRECLNKGRSIFAPVKKINRVLNANSQQYSFDNNLKVFREAAGLTQGYVCQQMQKYDSAFDKPMLSKMENNFCLPTPFQLAHIAELYGCETWELVTPVYF